MYIGTISQQKIRENFVASFLLIFLFIVISTEVLSLIEQLNAVWVAVTWTIFLVTTVFLFIIALLRQKSVKFFDLRSIFSLYRFSDKLVLLVIIFFLVVTLFIGLIYPPNTWDSLTYHMARIVHWIENGNVHFYPTAIDRQNYQPPLAEFAILHLQLLTGGDRYANIIQWFSFIISIILVTLLSEELGVPVRNLVLTAGFAVTLPMAILQSSSSQNDVVLSVFCLAFCYYFLRLIKTGSGSLAFFCMISLGMALLTKGTAYIYCAMIGCMLTPLFLVRSFGKGESIRRISLLVVILLGGLLLNSGHYYRSYRFYGHPLSTAEDIYRNENITIRGFYNNCLRNSALHFSSLHRQTNEKVFKLTKSLLLPDKNKRNTTYPGTKFRIPTKLTSVLHEDTAPNTLHLLIFLSCLTAFPLLRLNNKGLVLCYMLMMITSFLLFCLLLRWQPWASRLHTPLFFLSVPFMSIVISHLGAKNRSLFIVISILLFIYAFPFALLNSSRPLLDSGWSLNNSSRNERYFSNHPEMYSDYRDIVQKVVNLQVPQIGLLLERDDGEYPLWVLAGGEAGKGKVSFVHIIATSLAEMDRNQDTLPAFVLTTKTKKNTITIGKYQYERYIHRKFLALLKKIPTQTTGT